MEFNEKRLDFVRRTRVNLDTTEVWRKEHPKATFHEVTHLVNSMLGLLIVPKEMMDAMSAPVEAEIQPTVSPTGIREWDVSFLLQPATHRHHRSLDSDGLPTDLRVLVNGLRNAVAHYALKFGVEDKGIASVVFQVRPWDREEPPSPPWDATFTISELLAFVQRLADAIEQVQEEARLQRISRRASRAGADQ
jgi:HEPN pEK499 p136